MVGIQRTALRLAAAAEVDVRTARKVIEQGAGAVKGRTGERIVETAARLGIELGRGVEA